MLVNPYNGYYLYNEVPFGTADEVLYSIIKNNDSSPNLRLWFHDELFSKINWTQEPIDTLENLYIARAKQLREQYDYLILQFSGGSDSSQVLQTFLRNNIFLDEIRSYRHRDEVDRGGADVRLQRRHPPQPAKKGQDHCRIGGPIENREERWQNPEDRRQARHRKAQADRQQAGEAQP